MLQDLHTITFEKNDADELIGFTTGVKLNKAPDGFKDVVDDAIMQLKENNYTVTMTEENILVLMMFIGTACDEVSNIMKILKDIGMDREVIAIFKVITSLTGCFNSLIVTVPHLFTPELLASFKNNAKKQQAFKQLIDALEGV